MQVTVKLAGSNEFIGYTKSYQSSVVEDIDRIMAETMAKTERAIKLNTPVDTGYLRNSEGYEKISDLVYEVYANADYAFYVEALYESRGDSFFFANLERYTNIMKDKISQRIIRG